MVKSYWHLPLNNRFKYICFYNFDKATLCDASTAHYCFASGKIEKIFFFGIVKKLTNSGSFNYIEY